MSRLIAFIAALALAGCSAKADPIGDAVRGKVLMTTYGCGTCHETPGVAGAHGMVGPPLTHMARRTIIAGLLPNTAPNMVHWLRQPQSVVPGNAMPNMAMSERDGRDLTAFLATLR
jgi:cytochrome c2